MKNGASSSPHPSLGYLVVRPATLQVDAQRLTRSRSEGNSSPYAGRKELVSVAPSWGMEEDIILKVKFIIFTDSAPDASRQYSPFSKISLLRAIKERHCSMPLALESSTIATAETSGDCLVAFDEDDEINVRCCKGWRFVAQAEVKSASASSITDGNDTGDALTLVTLTSTRLTVDGHVNEITDIELLDPEGIVCGFLSVSIDFYPNHQDMLALSRDCALQSDLPRLLTEELQRSVQELKYAASNANYIAQLDGAVRTLHTFINHGKLYAILARFLKESVSDRFDELASIADEHIRSVDQGNATNQRFKEAQATSNDHTIFHKVASGPLELGPGPAVPTPPEIVESFRAVACTRHLLNYLLQEFKLFTVPEPSIELVEKLLALYMHAIHELLDSKRIHPGGGKRKETNTRANTNTEFPSFSIRLSDKTIRFPVFVEFAVVASLWYLQHVFLFVSLNSDCEISSTEITSIWQRFQVFDSTLSGYIPSSDLILLLQDMGGEYFPDEIHLILSEVDPDELGIVEFSSFIEWWSEA